MVVENFFDFLQKFVKRDNYENKKKHKKSLLWKILCLMSLKLICFKTKLH